MTTDPRTLTADDVRDLFLNQCRVIIGYWSGLPNKTPRERVEGAVFSILTEIDGESALLPAFALTPRPHPSDRDYFLQRGERPYPEFPSDCDIAGELHNKLRD